jgi:hypothetical protein
LHEISTQIDALIFLPPQGPAHNLPAKGFGSLIDLEQTSLPGWRKCARGLAVHTDHRPVLSLT